MSPVSEGNQGEVLAISCTRVTAFQRAHESIHVAWEASDYFDIPRDLVSCVQWTFVDG